MFFWCVSVCMHVCVFFSPVVVQTENTGELETAINGKWMDTL